MKQLFLKYKEMILYIVFGAITTLVDLVVYKLCCVLFGTGLYLVWNVVAWAAAVLTAFFTNKLWVFESKSWALSALGREVPPFVGGRLATFGLEEAGLALALALGAAGFWLMFWKVALSFGAVALNYGISKLILFKKK